MQNIITALRKKIFNKLTIICSWKDIIPQMLTAAMVKSDIEHNGIKMTGLEFKSQIVSAIIQHDWNDNMIGNIASMFM